MGDPPALSSLEAWIINKLNAAVKCFEQALCRAGSVCVE